MDNQNLSRQIKDFIHALALLDDEDAQELADCFQSIVQSKRTEETRAANAQPDKRPNAVESRRVEERNRCSFCGKSEKQVRRMIVGPGVNICDECVYLCYQLLQESFSDEESVEESTAETENDRTQCEETPTT